MAAAAAYSDRLGGAAVLVIHRGEVIFDHVAEGVPPGTPIHLHSGTKAFWGPVVVAMIDDGLIDSFDELASETLREWRDVPSKSEITVRHLMELNSGLSHDGRKLQGYGRPNMAEDLYAYAVTLRSLNAPGKRFSYGPGHYYPLAEVLKRKLRAHAEESGTEVPTLLEYLQARILDPIGVEVGPWVHDASGNSHVPNGAQLTAENWARFGWFVMHDGSWGGEQIVPADLMRELKKPSSSNPGHGLCLWLNTPGGSTFLGRRNAEPPEETEGGLIYSRGYADMTAALGLGKNRMYMVPGLDLVIVRQTERGGDRFDDDIFLGILLDGEEPQEADMATSQIRATFDLLDKEGDQRLTIEEIPSGNRLRFPKFDSAKDGSPSYEEFISALIQRHAGEDFSGFRNRSEQLES
ncbi:MAG: serine hydrolase [Fimbriimonadaceae bacterium]